MVRDLEVRHENWSGEEWARPLLDQLLGLPRGGVRYRTACAGWIRVAEVGSPGNAVFVLTVDRLGFASAEVALSHHWVSLGDIMALDLLEGLPHPLSAVEVQLRGGRSLLVGWTEEFCSEVVAALQAQVAAESAASQQSPTLSGPVEIAELDEIGPSPMTEPAVDPSSAYGAVFTTRPMMPVHPSGEGDARPAADDGTAAPEAGPAPQEPPVLFGRHSNSELDAAMDGFFEDVAPTEGPDDGATGPGTRRWPDPFTGVICHGGLDAHTRRRKHVTLTFSEAGMSATAGGLGHWSMRCAPDELVSVTVQGADELMFTHGIRVGTESAAVVVQTTDDIVIFELPGRGVAGLRHDLAGMSLPDEGPGPGQGPADQVGYF